MKIDMIKNDGIFYTGDVTSFSRNGEGSELKFKLNHLQNFGAKCTDIDSFYMKICKYEDDKESKVRFDEENKNEDPNFSDDELRSKK